MSDEAPTHRQCTKCGEMKPLDAFDKQQHGKYGKRSQCKVCRKAYSVANAEHIREYGRTRRATNADELKEYFRAHYAANAKSINERCRAYHRANAEKIKEQKRRYRMENADKIRQSEAAWRANNSDKIHAYRVAYTVIRLAKYKANPDQYLAITHRYRARKKGNGGTFTAKELRAMRIEYAGVCAYCKGQHEPNELTIDHVIPIDHGGPHEAANIVLACDICNKSKNNRTPEQWTNRWYERKNRRKKK